MVAIIEGNNSSELASEAIADNPNCIPKIECITANINGSIKNIAICLNSA